MKKNKLLFIILLLPFSAFCQSLTGLWNGTFSNDSTTLRTDQPFEIALTEYRGKIYGYSRREFIKNDTLYFVLKRVKGKITGDSCEVTEDEFVSHNLPTIDKGVKITYTFRFNKNDSTWTLDGRWKTNKVVKRRNGFYALTGQVGMVTQKDLSKSKLFPHLEELNLAKDVPFYVENKKQEQLRRDIAEQAERDRKNEIAKAEAKKKTEKPAPVKTEPVTKQADIAKINTDKEKQKEQTQVKTEPPVVSQKEVVKSNPEIEKKKEDTVAKKQTVPVLTDATIAKTNTDKEKQKEQVQTKTEPPVTPQKDITKSKPEIEKKKEDTVAKKQTVPVVTDVTTTKPKEKTDSPSKPVAAANVEKRKSETSQVVEFKSDSLVLALYDNGEIDGDTVSVLINGEVVMAQQGLKASAIKKTIYITPAMQDSFILVLYAENLGKYPPNTGLIIVKDGDDSYQVRFSADLQKNVAVLFKRKKK